MQSNYLPKSIKVIAAYLGVGVVVLIAAVMVFIATRTAEFRIQRSAAVGAPADVVFSLINDFHNWVQWSPYEKFDPNMKQTFEGPATGPGASYAWSGNDKAGEGRITILESKPGELVRMQLEFTRPFACTNEVNFKLAPDAAGTQVSWIMDGKNSFVGKAFAAFMDMDKMVGQEFENGLANLDAAAQAETARLRQAAPDAAGKH